MIFDYSLHTRHNSLFDEGTSWIKYGQYLYTGNDITMLYVTYALLMWPHLTLCHFHIWNCVNILLSKWYLASSLSLYVNYILVLQHEQVNYITLWIINIRLC